jgi:hypothetical protein
LSVEITARPAHASSVAAVSGEIGVGAGDRGAARLVVRERVAGDREAVRVRPRGRGGERRVVELRAARDGQLDHPGAEVVQHVDRGLGRRRVGALEAVAARAPVLRRVAADRGDHRPGDDRAQRLRVRLEDRRRRGEVDDPGEPVAGHVGDVGQVEQVHVAVDERGREDLAAERDDGLAGQRLEVTDLDDRLADDAHVGEPAAGDRRAVEQHRGRAREVGRGAARADARVAVRREGRVARRAGRDDVGRRRAGRRGLAVAAGRAAGRDRAGDGRERAQQDGSESHAGCTSADLAPDQLCEVRAPRRLRACLLGHPCAHGPRARSRARAAGGLRKPMRSGAVIRSTSHPRRFVDISRATV